MSDYKHLLKLYKEIDVLVEQQVDSENKVFKIWKSKINLLLRKIFGENSSELREFKKYSFALRFSFGNEKDEDLIKKCCDDLQAVKPIIENFLEVIKEEDDVAVYVADVNVKKKYQVFISSTYKDLIDERHAVTMRLLDNNCIPVGMEQFPANGMNQMEYIEKILDDCDYYVLILAGKYGTIDKDGVSFTEKEYEFAKSKKIPVLSFVYKDIGKLPSEKCEKKASVCKKLESFRSKVCNGGLVNFYSDINDLQIKIVSTINKCKEDLPAAGWVRGEKKKVLIQENDCEGCMPLAISEIDDICK